MVCQDDGMIDDEDGLVCVKKMQAVTLAMHVLLRNRELNPTVRFQLAHPSRIQTSFCPRRAHPRARVMEMDMDGGHLSSHKES